MRARDHPEVARMKERSSNTLQYLCDCRKEFIEMMSFESCLLHSIDKRHCSLQRETLYYSTIVQDPMVSGNMKLFLGCIVLHSFTK